MVCQFSSTNGLNRTIYFQAPATEYEDLNDYNCPYTLQEISVNLKDTLMKLKQHIPVHIIKSR